MGDSMEHKISVLDVDIDTCTAKEALKKTIDNGEPLDLSVAGKHCGDGNGGRIDADG